MKRIPAKIVFREYSESLILAISLALILRYFVISAYKIPTGSMIPTLKVGDFIFAYKLPYGVPVPFSDVKLAAQLPERGDVVVFRYPGRQTINYVKRVVGLPGDRIAIVNRKLFINGNEATYKAAGNDSIADVPAHELYTVYTESFDQFGKGSHAVMVSAGEGGGDYGPIVVPPGQIFVLGDNRDSSDDSRYWGCVPLANLEGRVVLVWLSLDWLERWGEERLPSVRWERVLRAVR